MSGLAMTHFALKCKNCSLSKPLVGVVKGNNAYQATGYWQLIAGIGTKSLASMARLMLIF
jgi:hypothetical protein